MTYKNNDKRIIKIEPLLSPKELLEKLPASEVATNTVAQARNKIHNIINGLDDRLLVVIGPCSIHDPKVALDYARKIQAVRLHPEIYQNLEVVMRVYFEKPRTTVGWKGLINDPYLDESYQVNDGLKIARQVLSNINNLGVPTACEFLDIVSPQYMVDLVSWGAIGARTVESQIHRELASGLPCAVGFKNATSGSVQNALDGMRCANTPHHFLSITQDGRSAVVSTQGNSDCHIILRGGKAGTNYHAEMIEKIGEEIAKVGYRPHVMVDFSHANSQKQFKQQLTVCDSISEQITNGSELISGVMIESHLVEGRQDLIAGQELVYGQSITDACINWQDSEKALFQLANAVATRRKNREKQI
ncbi:3-deoxy-7-phosphoheptulonate synthase AroG [Phocoenobacter uteri]|nr:3-deoxy-7-phosphoheptulonate synthase AroG [Phocoenobacter uteri]MDG6882577.1 3-deoxy-7-phosphoheptulonate synthase [Phocoenobacter uteri]